METQQWTSYIKKVINKTEENRLLRKFFDNASPEKRRVSTNLSNDELSPGYSISSIGTNDSGLKRVTLNLSENKIYDSDSHRYLTPISNPKFLLSAKKYDLPECKRAEIITITNNKKNLQLNRSFERNVVDIKGEKEEASVTENPLYISIKSNNSLNDVREEEKPSDREFDVKESSTENILQTSKKSASEIFGNISPIPKTVNNKFVINLFESRACKRWKRNICMDNSKINSSEIKIKDTPNLFDLSATNWRNSTLLNVISNTAIYDMIQEITTNVNGNSQLSRSSIDSFHNQSDPSTDALIKYYRNETESQCQIMVEATKILEKCRRNKKFYGSVVHIEAEKILLLSTIKYDTIINKVLKNQYEYLNNKKLAIGTIILSNIQFCFSQSLKKEKRLPEKFLCVISSGDKICSTKIMIPEGNSIKFNDHFLFNELDWNFQITISLYCIDLPKRRHSICCCFKKHIEEESILKMLRYKDLKTNEIIENYVTNTSFKLCATSIVELKHVKRGQIMMLNKKINWLDYLYLDVKLGDVTFHTRWTGFLTMGKNKTGYIAWSRRWCVLEACTMKIYNYPSEEIYTYPIETINLKKIVPPYIVLASRNICPRLRTVVLHVGHQRRRFQYYISTDTIAELREFKNIVEDVVTYLKYWNLQTYSNEILE